jgi:hypothetical protein
MDAMDALDGLARFDASALNPDLRALNPDLRALSPEPRTLTPPTPMLPDNRHSAYQAPAPLHS